jgi:hypothetical protein
MLITCYIRAYNSSGIYPATSEFCGKPVYLFYNLSNNYRIVSYRKLFNNYMDGLPLFSHRMKLFILIFY